MKTQQKPIHNPIHHWRGALKQRVPAVIVIVL
jgi:hypothetical protein